MAYTYWFVKAVAPTPGFDALLKPTTLNPGQKGRMLCADAEAAAAAGRVEMLSPGAMAALTTTPAPAPNDPRVEAPLDPSVLPSPVPRPRGPQARKSA